MIIVLMYNYANIIYRVRVTFGALHLVGNAIKFNPDFTQTMKLERQTDTQYE